MLTTPEGFRLYYALEYQFKTSNNEAEYKAVLGGLRVARALGVEKLRIQTDSRLVVEQLKGSYETKGENRVTRRSGRGGQNQEVGVVLRDENMMLYKRSFGGPLLLCLFPIDADKFMEEAHQGICSAHQGTHTLAQNLVL